MQGGSRASAGMPGRAVKWEVGVGRFVLGVGAASSGRVGLSVEVEQVARSKA